MKTWKEMIDEIIVIEGGFSDHPADKGGATMYGITESVARANGFTGRMQDMPVEFARQVYQKRYWSGPRFDDIGELSPVIATELLDTGINMGPAVASTFLQRALNALNQQGKLYPDLKADGAIGPATLGALKSLLLIRGTNGAEVVLRLINAQQAVRYLELAERNPTQEAFLYGWILNRVGGI